MSTCAWEKPPQRVQSAEITPAHSVGPRTHAYCTRQDMNICGVCARARAAQVELPSLIYSERKLKMSGCAAVSLAHVAEVKVRRRPRPV